MSQLSSLHRRVSVVISSPSTPQRATTNPTDRSRIPTSNRSSSSPDPLTSPAVAPRIIEHRSVTVAVKHVYVPNSHLLPVLTDGPSDVSPSYGQESILRRVYYVETRKWFYEVKKSVKLPLIVGSAPRGEPAPTFAPASSEEASIEAARSTSAAKRDTPLRYASSEERTSPLLSSSKHKPLSTNRRYTPASASASNTTSPEPPYSIDANTTVLLVPAEEILSHVSAAELEDYENDKVREDAAEDMELQRVREELRARKVARKADAYAASQARGIGAGVKALSLGDEGSGESEEADSERMMEEGQGLGMKRKAGLMATAKLSAYSYALSDEPMKRSIGRPPKKARSEMGGGRTYEVGDEDGGMKKKTKTKTVAEEPQYAISRLVRDLPIQDSELRQFEVEWQGYPGENTWEVETGLPAKLVAAYDRRPKGRPRSTGITSKPSPKTSKPASAYPSPAKAAPVEASHSLQPIADVESPTDDDELDGMTEDEYVIERIKRWAFAEGPGDVKIYEVAWKGYPGEDTWQAEHTLPREMLEEFWAGRNSLFWD